MDFLHGTKLYIIGVLLFSTLSFANQTPAENSLFNQIETNHKKKIYLTKDKTFSPFGEIFLFVAGTSDGEVTPLRNIATINSGKKIGVKLGASGRHSINHRYIEKNGKSTDGNLKPNDPSRFTKIYYDKDYPTLTVKEKNSKSYVSGSSLKYYKLNSTFQFSANDDYSGVNSIYVSVNDGETKVFGKAGGEISLENEGKYTFKIYTVDNVGNISREFKKNIFIDGSSPVSNDSITGHVYTDNNTPSLGKKGKVTLSATDSDAGVGEVYYKINNGKTKKYKKPVTTKGLRSGSYSLEYFAVDTIGNKEKSNTKKFAIDKTPPKTSLQILGDSFKGKNTTYVSARSEVELTSKDFSGVNEIRYKIGKVETPYTEPFKFAPDYSKAHKDIYSPADFKETVDFYGIDNLGNKEKRTTKTFILDRYSPINHINFKGKHFQQDGIHYISRSTKILLWAKDNLSGVNKIYYKFGNKEFTNYKRRFLPKDVMENQELTLSVESSDNVNNRSKSKKATIIIDTNPPKIYAHFSINGLRAKKLKLKGIDDSIETFAKRTKLYLGASDDDVGIDKIFYSIGKKGKVKLYKEPLSFKRSGVYTVNIQAFDKLGNKQIHQYRFRVVSHNDSRIIN
ncbi:MAG: DUF4998 domain-containing protein [Campylobacterales bacterium]|nr:DUF4998 domain-containing protein [Campylobacterales bacterium]